MPEPLEIEEAADDNDGDEDDVLESIVVPLVGRSSKPSRESLNNRTSSKHKRNVGTSGESQDNNDGGQLSLFLWLGAAVVASLIVYNMKHLGEMEDAAADELQSSTIHTSNATALSEFVNKTIHPR
ncbi:hypothetical protein MHU86_19652 [Fragilaria crotonensis]|nr:hypothetical protein MHU86_19652 [Fragilaria crotonensis]